MNRNTAIILFLSISIILAGIPQTFARPQYLTNLTAVYGDGSCETCHVINPGSGQRDFNGTMPNNSTRTLDRRNSNRTLPRNSYGTLFGNQPGHATDPNAALIAIGQPPAAAHGEPTVTATGTTKAAPGFDFVVFVFGSSAGILLARRHK